MMWLTQMCLVHSFRNNPLITWKHWAAVVNIGGLKLVVHFFTKNRSWVENLSKLIKLVQQLYTVHLYAQYVMSTHFLHSFHFSPHAQAYRSLHIASIHFLPFCWSGETVVWSVKCHKFKAECRKLKSSLTMQISTHT